ncbi:MAG: peptidoglycan editing factor PgeF [Oxalobacter sp.]|nr:MAG: peptidoglycan editing factor PgeF [Oxalobacter sp.]
MDLLLPDWPDAPANIGAFTTLRTSGVSLAPYDDGITGKNGFNLASHVGDNHEHVLQNRALLRQSLPSEPAWLTQTHSIIVHDAATVANAPEGDASFSTERNIVCVTMTADCLPVLFCDAKGTIVAAAHAGWRGLADGILEATVTAMRNKGAQDILAWMGPAIGSQSFEVGEDVIDAFTSRVPDTRDGFTPISNQPGKYLGDMYQLARIVLNKVGVDRISGGGLCTMRDKKRFYSFRRNEVTGRMASVIWLK